MYHIQAHLPAEQGLKLYNKHRLILAKAEIQAHLPAEQGLKLRLFPHCITVAAYSGTPSSRTRIETNLLLFFNVLINVIQAHLPAEQGLKLIDCEIIEGVAEIQAHLPAEQGLKPELDEQTAFNVAFYSGTPSSRTRIETCISQT